MKSLIVLVFSLFSFAVSAHTTDSSFNGDTLKAPYTLPVPEGWGVEKFPIPIGFAPGIPYRGEEDIRFAPGWGKEGGDNYWSCLSDIRAGFVCPAPQGALPAAADKP